MNKRIQKKETNHMIGGLFTFALFGTFVLLSLLLVAIGVDGYRNVVDQGESIGALRTALGYIESKINGGAGNYSVAIGAYDGIQALTLTQLNREGEPLVTVIYHQDGMLYENFFNEEEMVFDPEFGMRLSPVASIEITAPQSNLLCLTATAADGRSQTLHVALRGGQEVKER